MDTTFLVSLVNQTILSGHIFNIETKSVLCRYTREYYNWNRETTNEFIEKQIHIFKMANLESYKQIYQSIVFEDKLNITKLSPNATASEIEVYNIQKKSKLSLREYYNKYQLLAKPIQDELCQFWSEELRKQLLETGIRKIYNKIFGFNAGDSIDAYFIKVVDYLNFNREIFKKFEELDTFLIIIIFVDRLKSIIQGEKILHPISPIPNKIAYAEFRFYNYLILAEKLNQNLPLINCKWQDELSKLSALTACRFSESINDKIDSFADCLALIVGQGQNFKIKSLRANRMYELLLAVENTYRYLEALNEDLYDFEMFCLKICQITSDEWHWLLEFKRTNQIFPVFWIFRQWIKNASKKHGNSEIVTFILLNCIENGSLKAHDLVNVTNFSNERIRQLFDETPSKLITLINQFRVSLESYEQTCVTVLPDYKFLLPGSYSFEINSVFRVNFTHNFYIIFYSSFLPEKFKRIGDDKYLCYESIDRKNNENNFRNALYLATCDENYYVLLSCLSQINFFCINCFRQEGLIVSEYSSLSDWNKKIVAAEGIMWKSKIQRDGSLSTIYVNTRFSILESGQLIWLDISKSDLDIALEIFLDLFFNKVNPQILTLAEIQCNFGNRFLREDGSKIDIQASLARLKDELSLFSVANKWMSKKYAENYFDYEIFSKTKCSFKDAIYYMIIKDRNQYNNLPLSKWVKILNKVLNQNYTSNNLTAIFKDSRFNFIKEKNGRTSRNLIHISDYGV